MSEENATLENEKPQGLSFVEEEVYNDLRAGKNGGRLNTRFPPEPNGYLHIGHAKAICMDFGVAEKFGGTCNLRFDDTNPVKEDVEYVDSIREDIHWLGFDWGDREYYASDYFPQLLTLPYARLKKARHMSTTGQASRLPHRRVPRQNRVRTAHTAAVHPRKTSTCSFA